MHRSIRRSTHPFYLLVQIVNKTAIKPFKWLQTEDLLVSSQACQVQADVKAKGVRPNIVSYDSRVGWWCVIRWCLSTRAVITRPRATTASHSVLITSNTKTDPCQYVAHTKCETILHVQLEAYFLHIDMRIWLVNIFMTTHSSQYCQYCYLCCYISISFISSQSLGLVSSHRASAVFD